MTTPVDIAAVTPRQSVLGRRWWKMWLLLFDLCLLAGIIVADQRPYWQLATVEFDGPDEWAEMAQACVVWPADSNYLHVAVDTIHARLQRTFGNRADVRVKLTLPDAVTLSVSPRAPVLWVSARQGLLESGAALVNPVAQPSRPYWHRLGKPGTASSARADTLATGLWSAITAIDERFAQITSEWRYDIKKGWTVIAGDGQTRIILGHANVAPRARAVAALLSQQGTILTGRAVIDARFPGQIIVRAPKEKSGKKFSNVKMHFQNTQALRRNAHSSVGGEGEGA
jgi:hypothetical protein